ncbi:hypothetical protein [Tessaracoccus defluvii]|uniref:Uncharacterized protein n=1 Tax=Tessaracoccus defluvii TaxID=1285901 RepID=A0A7H0H7S4_9ACTN|nr:hypothetical protein [Tessaracoccus defluvii]QNP56590.1 hypothetical protein H9L22_04025 [Tessaracoccus defluvii]
MRVVDAGSRRFVAVAPEGRPDLRLPQAHPSRPVAPGRVGRVASCVAVRPQPQPRWLAAKVVGLCLLALVGVGVSAGEFASMATPIRPASTLRVIPRGRTSTIPDAPLRVPTDVRRVACPR